jgi:hypothetical protein
MKIKLILTIALLLTTLAGYSQNSATIKFKFKNSSIFPRKFTLISYTPDDKGNGTQGFLMWPGGTKNFSFKEGTKLYLANQKQVDIVMSGNRIDSEKPFLIITKESRDKVYKF